MSRSGFVCVPLLTGRGLVRILSPGLHEDVLQFSTLDIWYNICTRTDII